MAQTALSSAAAALNARLSARTARTGVVGLGYVGLPLAVEFARAGFHTVGIELDAEKVATITRGASYIPDVPSADVQRFRQAGTLSATTDPGVVGTLDTINICVPTPLRKTKDPDLSYIVSAVRDDRGAPASRPAGDPRVDDLPRHDRRGRQAASRTRRARRGARFLPRLLARARRPGQRHVDTRATCRRSSAA